MYPFNARQTARFSCEADFAVGAYLNLHFLDAERAVILFHVSLRRDEGLIVVNRRETSGWRREIHMKRVFARGTVRVDVNFGAAGATLWVDGVRAGRFDALPRPDLSGPLLLRRGFPGLRDIAYVDIEGPCRPGSILITTGVMAATPVPARGLYLSDALEIGFAGLTASESATLQAADAPAILRISGNDERFAAFFRDVPRRRRRARRDLTVLLPGRVWDAAEGALSLKLHDPHGAELGALKLEARTLAERIGMMADGGTFLHADRVALTAIEHAHHARLLPLLTADQREALLKAAERFGLADYLVESSDAPAQAQPLPDALKADTVETAVTEVRKRFARDIAQSGEDPIAFLDALQRDAALPGEAQALLCVSMTEWFCLEGRGMDLARYRRTLDLGKLASTSTMDDAWMLSAHLPLLYAEGAFAEVSDALWRLSTMHKGWVLTSNIGWIAERAARSDPDLDGGPLPTDQRRSMIEAILSWIENRAAEYWERTECEALIRGVVVLLSQGETLPFYVAERLVWLVLRAYGLSPSFWAALDAAPQTSDHLQHPALGRAQQAFDTLRHLIAANDMDPAARQKQIDDVIDNFRQFGTHMMQQFRRDLLGPAGIAMESGALPDSHRCLMVGLDPSEAVLRHMAFPCADDQRPVLPDEFRKVLADGIVGAWSEVPRSPLLALQVQVTSDASAYLSGAPVDVGQLRRRLWALGGKDGGFLGLGLSLSLARGLIAQGREDDAEAMIGHATTQIDALVDDWILTDLERAAAPANALWALQAEFPDHPLTRRALSALSPRLAPLPPAPTGTEADDLSQGANPVFDTLVCLYTCRANLDTRVAAIRQGWLRDLDALGVPVLVFVGDGDGRREGDIIHLDAPDDYESLPQKTLAMVRWVLSNTRFSHLLKIDDDCFLDARTYFESLSHLKADYYGRPLYRVRGQMDRTWHMAKSRSARGRLELDKSPEPSTYADGGSAYALSRRAMNTLIEVADSAQGRELIALSFMEDKLVGDLLATRDIWVKNEDYRVSVLRRTRPGGPLVAKWENGFLPFVGSGIKLAHLDGHEKQGEVLAASARPWPTPHKIWPSFQPVKLGARSNTLDLVSTPERLAQVNAAPVALVACLRNEAAILPRFLEHYRALGVQGFLIADNGSDDGGFEYLAEQPDVALFAVDTDYSLSGYGVAWQQALMANLRCGRWSLVADADEFLFWTHDRRGSLPDLAQALDAEGADAVRVFMLDMYPGGPLADADFRSEGPFEQAPFVDREPFCTDSAARGPFSNGPIWTSALRHRLIPGSRPELFVAQKYALLKYRPWMRLTAGLHFVANVTVAQRELFFGHFKYNAAFHAKAQAEVARKQHFNDAEEYRKYLALASEGRDVVFDPEISVRWDECRAVLDRLASE